MDSNYCVVRVHIDCDILKLSPCPTFDKEKEPTIYGHKTYGITNGKAFLCKTVIYQSNNTLIFTTNIYLLIVITQVLMSMHLKPGATNGALNYLERDKSVAE